MFLRFGSQFYLWQRVGDAMRLFVIMCVCVRTRVCVCVCVRVDVCFGVCVGVRVWVGVQVCGCPCTRFVWKCLGCQIVYVYIMFQCKPIFPRWSSVYIERPNTLAKTDSNNKLKGTFLGCIQCYTNFKVSATNVLYCLYWSDKPWTTPRNILSINILPVWFQSFYLSIYP